MQVCPKQSNCYDSECQLQPVKSKCSGSLEWSIIYQNSQQDCQSLAEPIRELSKDKVPFNWGPELQETFKHMKKEIARDPILAYHNPRKQNILQTDASIKGLGACFLQDEKWVYFASKALTEAQKDM